MGHTQTMGVAVSRAPLLKVLEITIGTMAVTFDFTIRLFGLIFIV